MNPLFTYKTERLDDSHAVETGQIATTSPNSRGGILLCAQVRTFFFG